jgi:hypothetical protein
MRSLAGLVLVAVAVGSSEAAVFCAKPSRDGTLNGSVKVREACKRNELQLAPGDVGFCCGTPTTVTTPPARARRSQRPRWAYPTAGVRAARARAYARMAGHASPIPKGSAAARAPSCPAAW